MSFKPIDGKRDEFRKYLERTGVLEAITKVLIKLLNSPERPENAVEFIRNNLGVSLSHANTIKQLTADLEDAQNEIAQLKRTVEQLQANKVKDAAAPEQTPLSPAQSTPSPPTAQTKEVEEPPAAAAAAAAAAAVPEKLNTEVPVPTEPVQLAEPDSTEQENKPAPTEVSSPTQEGGGN